MFEAQRFSHTQVLTLDGDVDTVFPLFGPVREREWAAGWNPNLIAAETALGDQAGTIFTSQHPGEADTIWYVNRFDHDEHAIQYLRITPDRQFAMLDIRCEALAESRTQASVTYSFTALSEAGNRAFSQLRAHHPPMVQQWETLINDYLRSR